MEQHIDVFLENDAVDGAGIPAVHARRARQRGDIRARLNIEPNSTDPGVGPRW
jgi:hypothetical protein